MSNEFAVEVEMNHGEVGVLQGAGIKFSFTAAEFSPMGVAVFPTPGEALRAAAVLADAPNWYPGARTLARKAAQVIPTRLHLDAYPPRVQHNDGT